VVLTLLYSKVTAVLLASTYKNRGLVQSFSGLSLEVYSEKLSKLLSWIQSRKRQFVFIAHKKKNVL